MKSCSETKGFKTVWYQYSKDGAKGSNEWKPVVPRLVKWRYSQTDTAIPWCHSTNKRIIQIESWAGNISHNTKIYRKATGFINDPGLESLVWYKIIPCKAFYVRLPQTWRE